MRIKFFKFSLLTWCVSVLVSSVLLGLNLIQGVPRYPESRFGEIIYGWPFTFYWFNKKYDSSRFFDEPLMIDIAIAVGVLLICTAATEFVVRKFRRKISATDIPGTSSVHAEAHTDAGSQ